ncbi:MAG: type II toxin-antitoxin system RelE/ParE family toxin [Cyclobacteriaceae bacterium]|jgi:toxin HigB-1
MIVSFKHKGLELFFTKGNGSKLNPKHLKRIRQILTVLHSADKIQDIDVPGYDLHPLKGKYKGAWAVKVSGNYRIVFEFIESKIEVIDVDYLDYH